MRKRREMTRRVALLTGGAMLAAPALAQPPLKTPGVYDADNPPLDPQPTITRTPGVYINEDDAFPNSVVGVETSVVAFIGPAPVSYRHIEKVTSLSEYVTYFGWETPPVFGLGGGEPRIVGSPPLIERSVRWFYLNGGTNAYVLGAGRPDEPLTLKAMLDALARAADNEEVTLLVAPDAIRLSLEDCITFQQAMLAQCAELGDRFAILDVHPDFGVGGGPLDAAAAFGKAIGTKGAAYGAAYYPAIETNIVESSAFTFTQFEDPGSLAEHVIKGDAARGLDVSKARRMYDELAKFDSKSARDGDKTAVELARVLNNQLLGFSIAFREMQQKMAKLSNHMPASPAVAGIYALTDTTAGVWNAPANKSVNGGIAPAISLDSEQSAALNNPVSGPPVNPIRAFVGEGVMVWGARTLDTDDTDNRYISVRRTMIFLKSSIGVAIQAYVFEPNDANTWATVRAMVSNFLTAQWQMGALMGATPDQAFGVQCGLGSTMTQQDIVDGRLRVSVLVAVSKPAEFQQLEFELALGVR